jgi:hypothetical protein
MVPPKPPTPTSLDRPIVGAKAEISLPADVPSSPVGSTADPDGETDVLNNPSTAIIHLPTSEHGPPRGSAAVRMPNDIVQIIVKTPFLDLQDVSSIALSEISPVWSVFATEKLLRRFKNTYIAFSTCYTQDHREARDVEFLYPVYGNYEPEEWVLPKQSIVFEHKRDDKRRHKYPRTNYRPGEMVIYDLPGCQRPYKWQLDPDFRSAAGPHDDDDYNCKRVRKGIYSVFNYYNERDLERRFVTKVWYRFNGDKMYLLALSIPLPLMGMLLRNPS